MERKDFVQAHVRDTPEYEQVRAIADKLYVHLEEIEITTSIREAKARASQLRSPECAPKPRTPALASPRTLERASFLSVRPVGPEGRLTHPPRPHRRA
jgi:hypothetical protein